MKKARLLLLTLATLALGMALTSCNQNNPSEADLFAGTYKGPISYTEPGSLLPSKTDANGTVTVTKVGDSYSFIFSSNIPNITGVKIAKGEKSKVTLGTDATGFITITGESLNIAYKTDKGGWMANCKRDK